MEVNWGNVESYSEVQSVNGLTGKVQLKIPTKTSDLVNDSGFVSDSNYATKEELTAVEQKIPNVSGFATKQELNTVQSSIPDTTGLATKVELSNVAANIPETYLKVANLGDGSLTIVNNKGESVVFTPAAAGGGGAVDSVNGQTGTVVLDIPTKVSELENDSGYLTSHQDISNLATKVELSAVESSIPSEYLKNASVADNKLTITKSSGDTIEFSGGGGGTVEKEWLIITADIGTITTEEGVSYSTPENVSATKEDIKAAYAAGQNILLKLNDPQIMSGIVVCMPFSYTPINDSVDLLLLGTMVAGNNATTYYIYYSMEDDMWSCNVFQMEYLDKAYGDSLYVDKENTLPTLATKVELSAVEAKIPNVSNFATINYVETAITNKGYQTQTQVQTLINNAISNIKNANEVSY